MLQLPVCHLPGKVPFSGYMQGAFLRLLGKDETFGLRPYQSCRTTS